MIEDPKLVRAQHTVEIPPSLIGVEDTYGETKVLGTPTPGAHGDTETASATQVTRPCTAKPEPPEGHSRLEDLLLAHNQCLPPGARSANRFLELAFHPQRISVAPDPQANCASFHDDLGALAAMGDRAVQSRRTRRLRPRPPKSPAPKVTRGRCRGREQQQPPREARCDTREGGAEARFAASDSPWFRRPAVKGTLTGIYYLSICVSPRPDRNEADFCIGNA